jgi:hypothetical protein
MFNVKMFNVEYRLILSVVKWKLNVLIFEFYIKIWI